LSHVPVLRITRCPPERRALAVEIPAEVKRQFQLHDDRPWVVRPEWNEFVRTGPDLRWLPGAADASPTSGLVTLGLFVAIRERFFGSHQFPNARLMPRT
jgi:hypothetical protein